MERTHIELPAAPTSSQSASPPADEPPHGRAASAQRTRAGAAAMRGFPTIGENAFTRVHGARCFYP